MSGEIDVGAGKSVFKTDRWSQWLERCWHQLRRSTATFAGVSILRGSGLIGLRLTSGRLHWSDDSSAASLAQLSGALILVQSFRGDPRRAVPSLWSERLGVGPANDLWRRYGRSVWWQGWSQDGDPYLILSASTLPAEVQGLQRERVGSMDVLASDALHRQQLQQRLKTNQVSSSSIQPQSIFGSCLQAMAEGPGVLWGADALATLSGTLAPLLQQGREGCVQLQLQSNQLVWEGVIGRRPLSSLSQRISLGAPAFVPGQLGRISNQKSSRPAPSKTRTLLQVDGQRIDLILGTLLSRQIIQAPLEEHYGIDGAMRSKIADLPFSIRLQSLSSGAYKAGLQVQLPLTGSRQQWTSILEAVSDRLRSRGFQTLQNTQKPGKPPSLTLWHRRDDSDQTTLGGWDIIEAKKGSVLSIGLGIAPATQVFLAPRMPQTSSLRLQADPQRLVQLGLLGGLWPQPVQKASSLTMLIQPLNPQTSANSARQSWWRVQGSLVLRAAP